MLLETKTVANRTHNLTGLRTHQLQSLHMLLQHTQDCASKAHLISIGCSPADLKQLLETLNSRFVEHKG